MDRTAYKVIILERSQIIIEGVLSILKNHHPALDIIRINNLQELDDYCMHHDVHMIFINPYIILNEEKKFNRFRKSYPATTVIALVYHIFPDEIMKHFDETIYITDSYHTIADKFHKAASINHNEGTPNDDLTSRELEVLKAITKGFSNKEIADFLNISIHTVISHRKNITEKTGIKSISGLTIYAISEKIILL